MPDFNVDEVLSKFGEKPKANASGSSFNVDEILSKFGSTSYGGSSKTEGSPTRVIINTDPKPPISGISKESSDELNQTRESKLGDKNPRRSLPVTNIQERAYEADKSAKEMFSSGITDLSTGHPYKGLAKTALGAVGVATAPMAGIIEGGIETLLTDITGNERFGKTAGFVAGAAIPLDAGLNAANKLAGGLPVLNKVSTYSKNKALSTLVENIGPENIPAVVSAMKANPRLAPADLSPRVLQDTQHLFTHEGPQIDYLAKTSADRLAGSRGTVDTALDASMGATVNAAQKVDELKKAAQEIGKKNIEPVLAAKPHVDVTALIKHIDSEIGYPAIKAIKEGKAPPLPLEPYQKELLNVRNKLRNTDWPDRDKMFAYTDQIHKAQIDLRELAQSLTKSSSGAERHTGSQLLYFREKMKDAVGPEYKEALSKYAGQKKIEDAFHNGYETILANSPKLENDPSFFEKWINSPSRKPGELEAAREGARLKIQHEINRARTAATNPSSKAIGIGQTEFSVQRIEALLGKEEASKLLKTLEDERKIANTHSKIIEGSQTAMRSASKSQFAMPTQTDAVRAMVPTAIAEGANAMAGGYPIIPTLALGGVKAGAMVNDAVKLKLAREHNAQYAKLALPVEGPKRDELIRQLETYIPKPKLSMLNRVKTSLPVSP